MKRTSVILVLLALIVVAVGATAQRPKSYRHLRKFDGDTVAYLTHNWGFHTAGAYTDRTIGDFLDDCELPIKSVGVFTSSTGRMFLFRFYVRDYDELYPYTPSEYVKRLAKAGGYPIDMSQGANLSKYSVDVFFSSPKVEEDYKHIFPNLFIEDSRHFALSKELRREIEDWQIDDVRYSLGIQHHAPKGYRSLSECEQDTIAYVEANWGFKSQAYFGDITVGTFLNIFELPIRRVSLRCDAGGRLCTIFLIFHPDQQTNDPATWGMGYVTLVLTWSNNYPTIEELSPTFEGLEPYKEVEYEWRDEYRSLFENFLLDDIQYNGGAFS